MAHKNHPTHKAISFPTGKTIVSRTDLHGVILDANDTFVEVSGYRKSELMGQAHSILRHPDMPKAAFADLWQTIKVGRTWRGIVKNMAKNGDHYWVVAHVTPIKKRAASLVTYRYAQNQVRHKCNKPNKFIKHSIAA